MQTINISEFRANLLKYLDIASSGEKLMITSNGNPLATISAPCMQKEGAAEQLRALSQTAVVHDIISPIDAQWDAQT